MRKLQTVPAGKFLMLCLTSRMWGTAPKPVIVTVRNDKELRDVLGAYVKATQPQETHPDAIPQRAPTYKTYCTCTQAKNNLDGSCMHNSPYLYTEARRRAGFHS